MDKFDRKITIRLLPPTLTRREFENQLVAYSSAQYNLSYYVPGSLPVNPFDRPIYSRWYGYFKEPKIAKDFALQIKDKPFTDSNGDSLIPQVTNSLNQRMVEVVERADTNKGLEDDEIFLGFKRALQSGEPFLLQGELRKIKEKNGKARRRDRKKKANPQDKDGQKGGQKGSKKDTKPETTKKPNQQGQPKLKTKEKKTKGQPNTEVRSKKDVGKEGKNNGPKSDKKRPTERPDMARNGDNTSKPEKPNNGDNSRSDKPRKSRNADNTTGEVKVEKSNKPKLDKKERPKKKRTDEKKVEDNRKGEVKKGPNLPKKPDFRPKKTPKVIEDQLNPQ